MNILKRYESDDFDESYAFDDAEYGISKKQVVQSPSS
jgi:hypothetical protein